jgi:hypothetical protein
MKYRPPLGLSQPLDRTRAAEIDVAYNCRQRRPSLSSSRDGPRAFRPPRRRDVAAFVRKAPMSRARRCPESQLLFQESPTKAESGRRSCQPERGDGQGRVPVVAVPRSAVLRKLAGGVRLPLAAAATASASWSSWSKSSTSASRALALDPVIAKPPRAPARWPPGETQWFLLPPLLALACSFAICQRVLFSCTP